MVANINTIAFQGVDAVSVEVQVHLAPGQNAFTVVGLPDKSVAESRERVRAALSAVGLALPYDRITINLSPADLPKEGSHYDLPIALGLLVPVWLIYEFDAGLFWERTYFGYWFESRGPSSFIIAGLMPVIAVVLSFTSVAVGWITSSLANAFFLVLSGLSLLSFLHQVYLWRETKVCKSANEDFAKKRQQNQMFFFLFFYTVAYLSGGESLRVCGVGSVGRRI